MTVVDRWTGREAKLLRDALRLSIRDFAARLGVGIRTVNKWEARQVGITPLPHMQEVLDTALARASDEAKARFAAATRPEVPEREIAQPSALPVRGAMLPVVVNGRVVFVPFDADSVAINDFGAVEDELHDATVPLVVGRIDAGCGVPQLLLDVGSGAVTVESSGGCDTRKVDWVLRRDFSGFVAAIALGLGFDALDVERLAALVDPGPVTSTAIKIGAADVEVIEQVTAMLRQWQHSSGGGLSRSAAVAQFRSVLPLLARASTPAVQERLVVAAADLGLVAAWANYDVERHDDARRLWPIALSVVRRVDTARATDLIVQLLLAMTHQALHLRRPQEGLGFVQLGYDLAADRSLSLAASTATDIAGYQAMCYAALGDAGACDRAIGQTIEHFASADPAKAAPWVAYVNAAELAAKQGHAQYTLALATADTKPAARAVPLLQQAVDSFGPAYARSRAVNLPGLAGAQALTGDLDAAVHTAHQAIEEITALTSPRAYDRLRTLDTVLRPSGTDTAVAEVRGRIREVLVAA